MDDFYIKIESPFIASLLNNLTSCLFLLFVNLAIIICFNRWISAFWIPAIKVFRQEMAANRWLLKQQRCGYGGQKYFFGCFLKFWITQA